MFTSIRLILVALFSMLAIVGCSGANILASAQNGGIEESASLSVSYIDESYGDIVLYRAVIEAPVGTVIYDGDNLQRMTSDRFEMLFVAQVAANASESEGPIGFDGIALSVYAPTHNFTGFTLVPALQTALNVSVEDYAYFIEEGKFPLERGEKVVLSDIEDFEIYVSVLRWPSEAEGVELDNFRDDLLEFEDG